MRQHLVGLLAPTLVGGCSLIYNPSNIDKPMHDARPIDMGEVPIDIEIRADASPRDLQLTEAFPTLINEGSGVMSRKALVVLYGMHFVKDASAALDVDIMPEVTDAAILDSFEVAGDGKTIALTLTVPVSTTCAESAANIPVDVLVKQNDGVGGMVMRPLDNAFSIKCLDELDAPVTTGLKATYSRIDFNGALDFGAGGAAVTLRSASYIDIEDVDVSATGRSAGPGGADGGTGGTLGAAATAGMGPGGGAAGGGGADGAGAGYRMMGQTVGAATGGPMAGDIWLSTLSTNKGSGGGGGGVGTGVGGAGGGGGGTLQLWAPGPITVGAITARGGDATPGGVLAGDGGAGSGGTVLIRTGATLTAGSISVAAGGLGSGGTGGTGSLGRIRVDAANATTPADAVRGPMFGDLPLFYTDQTPNIPLTGTPDDNTATIVVLDKANLPVAGQMIKPLFGPAGTAVQEITLKAGYNKICVFVAGGGASNPDSANCIETAYLVP